MLKIHPPAMFSQGLFQARRVTDQTTHICAAFLVSRALAEKAMPVRADTHAGIQANVGDIVMLGQGGQHGYQANKIHVTDAKGLFYRTDIGGRPVDLPLSQAYLFTTWMALRRKEDSAPLTQQDRHIKSSIGYLFDEVITMPETDVDPVLMSVCLDGAITRSFGAVPPGSARRQTGLLVARDRTMKAIVKAIDGKDITALERVRSRALLNDFRPVLNDLDREAEYLANARLILKGLHEARKDDLADILMSDPVISPMKNPVAIDFQADPVGPRPH